MAVKIGCCGFAGRRETYFKKFRVIEVEQTFYDPPRVFTAEKWRREAPERFQFVVRAWQVITHPASAPGYHRMQTRFSAVDLAAAGHFQPAPIVWQGWQRTRELAEALQSRAVLFQCPESFVPSAEHKENLRRFFHRVRDETPSAAGDFSYAWEPPRCWADADVAAMSSELGLVHAVDPFVCPPLTTGKCYLRLNGTKGYRHRHTDEELRQLAELMARFHSGYCLFGNLHMREDACRAFWLYRTGLKETVKEDTAA
ncbi:MAG: DUF72 domain-containing protein [Verrucomicrobia bacterium]|nr:DUF72 domain-containing protein [Verrucomicrobiota bacterium]